MTCSALSTSALPVSPGSCSNLVEISLNKKDWIACSYGVQGSVRYTLTSSLLACWPPLLCLLLTFFPCLFFFHPPWPLHSAALHIPKKQLAPSCFFPSNPSFATSIPTHILYFFYYYLVHLDFMWYYWYSYLGAAGLVSFHSPRSRYYSLPIISEDSLEIII